MSELVAFKKDHLVSLLDQKINVHCKEWFLNGIADVLANLKPGQGEAMSIIHNGVVMCCGGINTFWPGRGHLWCVFNEESKRSFVTTFRLVNKWISSLKYNRIELSVDHGEHFKVGARRAQLLGFKLEIWKAEKYLPDGGTVAVYVKVR